VRNKLFLLFIAAVMLQPAFAASLEELTGVERAAALRVAVEPITEVQMKNPSLRLLPEHEELRLFANETLSGLEPTILVETLSLCQRPKSSPQAANPAGWSSDEQLGLFNQLVALSTLTGIQYYSASRKAMRTLYEYSSVIYKKTRDSYYPLPDPVFTNLPNSLSLYARQKDLTFGNNDYNFEYRTGADIIYFSQVNLSSMSYGIIPVIGKENFRTVLAVIDAGDSLLIYAAATAKAASIPGMGDRVGASFTNRAKAILKWFDGRADKVFR